MTVSTAAGPGRSGVRRPGLRALRTLSPLLLALSCSSGATRAHAPPDAGRYPIATARPLSVGSATAGHFQLIAAGDAVHVQVGAARVLARMSGPELEQLGAPAGTLPPTSAPGVLTVTLTSEHGTLDVPAGSFLTLGQRQDAIGAHADHPVVHVAPGRPATLRLSCTFRAGHTTFTWQPQGRPLVTWDFVVELD